MNRIVLYSIAFLLIASQALAGGSRDFDGTADRVDFGDVNDVTTGAFTVMAWVRHPVDANFRTAVSKKDTFTNNVPGYHLQVRNTDIPRVAVDDGSANNTAEGSTSVEGTAWFHLTGTWDGTDTTEIFVNGVSEDTTVTTVTDLTTTSSFVVGEFDGGANDYLGQIAYVQFWNREISLVEIQQAMFYPGTITSGLTGFYPLWGDATEPNLSNNSDTGTPSGTVTSIEGPPMLFLGGSS